MYIDLDDGTIQFGSDTEFYGKAFDGVHVTDGALYPIVTAAVQGAIIGIVYRGQGIHVLLCIELLCWRNLSLMPCYKTDSLINEIQN